MNIEFCFLNTISSWNQALKYNFCIHKEYVKNCIGLLCIISVNLSNKPHTVPVTIVLVTAEDDVLK